MGVQYPVTPGGSIWASDSDSISESVDVSGLPIGTRVWNEDVSQYFKLQLSAASLVADSVLEVLGITGARWLIDNVSNAATATAPANATTFTAALNASTTALKGLQSSTGAGLEEKKGTDLTDADQTITPGSSKCSVYFARVATFTTNRAVTLSIAGATNGDIVKLIWQDVGNHTVVINNGAGSGLVNVNGNTNGNARMYQFYFSAGDWIFNAAEWVNN